MRPVIFPFETAPEILQKLARELDCEIGQIERRRFPDGESYVRLVAQVAGRHVVFLGSLDDPDIKTLPMLFGAEAAQAQGAASVGLIAPYLAYLRQDKAFRPGEALTSATYARLISNCLDWLVTVDPHLHRYASLDEIYTIPSAVATAAEPIARWVRANVPRPFLIGPDAESAQWVKKIATLSDAPSAVLHKARKGDFEVDIDDMTADMPADATPVIVDDIASSARTMIEAVRMVRGRNRPDPICVIVHALFCGDAYRQLVDAGPAAIISTNSVRHSSNAIDIGEEIGAAILRTPVLASIFRR